MIQYKKQKIGEIKLAKKSIAKNYLYNRKLNDSVIKEFGIGLSINDSDSLLKILKAKGYSDKDLIRSGLVNENNYSLN